MGMTEGVGELKRDLLRALKQTEKDNQLGGVPLPNSPDDIILGKPVDEHDLSKGWKATAQPNDDGLVLSDGKVLAFKFANSGKKIKKEGTEEEERTDDEDWNVVIPSFNDTYGTEEQTRDDDSKN